VISAGAPEPALRAVLDARMRGLIAGGVDVLLAETLASLAEVAVVLEVVTAAAAAGMPPLMLSVAVTAAGVLPSGETVEALAAVVADTPPWSVGLNCGSGIAGLRRPLEALAGLLPCRISCHPSAGAPGAFGDFDESPDETAAFLREAAQAGLVDVVGGCCGTTPEHIEAIAAAVRGLPARMTGF
jgi:5-methyltetrahydrofolate--homocysteine methyltransferase